MTQRFLGLFGIAGLIAAIVTLTGYLLSRDTGFADFFDDNWELIAMATGILILGLLVIAAGVGLFYSVEGSFLPFSVLISLGIMAVGGYLLYIGVSVIIEMGRASGQA